MLGADWRLGRFSASLNQLLYGRYTYVHPTNSAYDERYGAKGSTHLEIAYTLTDESRLTIGANNLFDTYPAQFIAANQVNGINRYSFFHPDGANGAFYYVLLETRFRRSAEAVSRHGAKQGMCMAQPVGGSRNATTDKAIDQGPQTRMLRHNTVV